MRRYQGDCKAISSELECCRWHYETGRQARPGRRQQLYLKRLSVDETAYRKGRDYITVFSDQQTGAVVHVSDDRGIESLSIFYETLTSSLGQQIEVVCMDMWPAYITATRHAIEDADEEIVFDRFHVAQYMSRA